MTESRCPACGAPVSTTGGSCGYCGAAIRDAGIREQSYSQPVEPANNYSDGFSVPESEVSEPLASKPVFQEATREIGDNTFPNVSQIPANINMGRVNTILTSAKKYLIFILIAIILFCVSCTAITIFLFSRN